jgi:hypothetical protein
MPLFTTAVFAISALANLMVFFTIDSWIRWMNLAAVALLAWAWWRIRANRKYLDAQRAHWEERFRR